MTVTSKSRVGAHWAHRLGELVRVPPPGTNRLATPVRRVCAELQVSREDLLAPFAEHETLRIGHWNISYEQDYDRLVFERIRICRPQVALPKDRHPASLEHLNPVQAPSKPTLSAADARPAVNEPRRVPPTISLPVLPGSQALDPAEVAMKELDLPVPNATEAVRHVLEQRGSTAKEKK